MWLGILLGNALMGLEGHGASSLRPVWNRAIELGEQVGDADELTAALNGLAVQEADNAKLDAAMALARRQLEIADESGSRFARLRGHGTMGLALFYRGNGLASLEHFNASLAHYRPGDFQVVTFGVGHDQGIFARAMSSWVLWWLGRPDAALDEIRATVAEAERLGSFLSLAMARHFLAVVHQLRRECEAALEQAQLNAAFAARAGLPVLGGSRAGRRRAPSARGWVTRPGLEDVGRGLVLLSDAGSRSGTSSGLGHAGRGAPRRRRHSGGARDRRGGLGAGSELGEPYWDAELMRLKAVFMLAADADGRAADDLLRAALADATERGAASLALRAATTLGQRLADQGRGAEALPAVASALAAVEGGEDTADVREAQHLIDSLPTNGLEARRSDDRIRPDPARGGVSRLLLRADVQRRRQVGAARSRQGARGRRVHDLPAPARRHRGREGDAARQPPGARWLDRRPMMEHVRKWVFALDMYPAARALPVAGVQPRRPHSRRWQRGRDRRRLHGRASRS